MSGCKVLLFRRWCIIWCVEINKHTKFFVGVEMEVIMNELTLTECSRRRLDETYVVVYAIKNEINLKKADYIEKK